MEIFPSECQQLDLSRHEKVFVRYAANDERYGQLLLKINPAMMPYEHTHAVIIDRGVILCKFLPMSDPSLFSEFIVPFKNGYWDNAVSTVGQKLISNKALVDESQNLFFRFSYILILPDIKKAEIKMDSLPSEMQIFISNKCMFSETFSTLRGNFYNTFNSFLEYPDINCSEKCINISEKNINSVLQRVAPEYTIVRYTTISDCNYASGASEELLVVSEKDTAVRAFRLEPEQINIVNKMSKGDQLILACAGSGKSVLLIAKCFKAAQMNPDKKFLLTCYNRNLQSLYTWYIERAGLKERNVDCCTFDGLCKKILTENSLFLPGGNSAIQLRRDAAIDGIANGKIKNRYYGIFIDEIQMFEPDWYKLCFNILENKESDDHIFVICGDKTQEIKQRQRHGKAPWNIGEGYPVYRGGNKSIRIEKNFRNCIEINAYINRFAQKARELVKSHIPGEEYDPDVFLRGQAFRNGNGVTIKQFSGTACTEAEKVVESIIFIHDQEKVPYDEIAVAMYNRQYRPLKYYLESALITALSRANIPYQTLYKNDQHWAGRYGDGGVSLITFDSVLGLDFQAVVACGIKPLGFYDRTKQIRENELLNEEMAENMKKNISYLYVACTRAKDYLHILLSETNNRSIYNRLLIESM